ncbi:MAG TPA: biotin carboxylase N-terminal domain-containing protein [Polyangiaceae bacterium]|nr:biotin carboxylase N-terminal domain-containing protein [Polyangiaceae bacterium]
MFKRVLVANRGEIACRVLRSLERLGVEGIAVFSDADRAAPHVAAADQAFRLGPAPLAQSYLNADLVLQAALDSGAEAIHPGYGLLSENASFAERVRAAGMTFIGPPALALAALGDKLRARAVARSVGASPPPGSDGPVSPDDVERLTQEAQRIGYPILIKAAGGGGGIGMQVVREAGELGRAARSCADRGKAAFADDRIYLERYLDQPRHIEVQVLCDEHGQAVALGERECSVQRRHQKIIEESPSPAAFFGGESGAARRHALYASALAIVQAVSYRGAGTVEFVANAEGELFFLEVNARLQVEHPVTEAVTGLDLVEQQLLVASGERLAAEVLAVKTRGHAIEARVYAEDPARGFLPQPGRIEELIWPSGAGIRVDSGVTSGMEVTPHYDPMLAKIIAFGSDRTEALGRLDAALEATRLHLVGPKGDRATNLAFLRKVLSAPEFVAGAYDTSLAETLVKRA